MVTALTNSIVMEWFISFELFKDPVDDLFV